MTFSSALRASSRAVERRYAVNGSLGQALRKMVRKAPPTWLEAPRKEDGWHLRYQCLLLGVSCCPVGSMDLFIYCQPVLMEVADPTILIQDAVNRRYLLSNMLITVV